MKFSSDDDLRWVLVECRLADTNAWHVLTFVIQIETRMKSKRPFLSRDRCERGNQGTCWRRTANDEIGQFSHAIAH